MKVDRTGAFLALTIFFVVVSAIALVPSRNYYSEKHPVLDEIRRRFSIINPKYGNIPIKTGNKSYTENKTMITLCIVNPHTQEFYDMNTLMFVALHELAHVITKADGDQSHGKEFRGKFAHLLKIAYQKGVYNPTKPMPETYCGVDAN